jgi:DNA-binding transcriptional ArsR family regulator
MARLRNVRVWEPRNREQQTAVEVLAALAQDNRLAIFRLLLQHAPGGLSAGAIAEQLAPKTIVSGHGQVCDLADAQRETRDHLALLLTEIRKRIDAGDDLQTTVDTLDQSAFAHLANFDELKRANANRILLELEREF